MGIERRAHPRYSVQLRVHVAELGEVQGSLTRDLSQGGLFLETSSHRRVGSLIPMALIDPDTATEVPVMGRVVRVVTEGDPPRIKGLAVQFAYTDPELDRRIRGLIEGIAQEEGLQPNPAQQPSQSVARIHLRRVGGFPPDAVPRIAPARGESSTRLSAAQRHMLAFVNAKATVDDILRACGLRVSEALKYLSELAELGVIEIPGMQGERPGQTADRESAASPADEPSTDGSFSDTQAETYLQQAQQATEKGRLAEAVHLLELALQLRPPHAARIHLHLSQLALHRLEDLDLAERHAVAARALDPDDADAAAVLQAVERARAEAPPAATAAPTAPPKPAPPERATPSATRKLLGVVLGVVLVAIVAFNVWSLMLPHGDRPDEVSADSLSEYVPVVRARLRERQLFITVDNRWNDWPEKTARLRELGEYARSELASDRVVVSDPVPRLRAVVTEDGVHLYGESTAEDP